MMLPNELKKLLAYIVPYRWSLVLTTLCLLAESATSLALPWLAGHLAGPLLRLTPEASFALVPLSLLLLDVCFINPLPVPAALRHSRESGNPGGQRHGDWMPAAACPRRRSGAGMTFCWCRTYEMDI